MNALIEQFLDYVSLECGLSGNTREAYASDLKNFQRFLESSGVNSVNRVTRRHVLDFLSSEKDRGLSVRSLSRRLVAIKVFFRYLVRESLLARDVTEVMDSPRLGRVLPSVLTYKEVERLLASPAGDGKYAVRDRAILELLYATGIRVSECAGLKLDDIHFDSGHLRCTGKGNKMRIVPFGEAARESLQVYLAEARGKFPKADSSRTLFLTCRGAGYSRKGLWALVKSHSRRAGISKEIHPHTLRHSFASHLLANGSPLRIIQEMLGHADIATTQVYTHVDQNMLKSVHEKYHPRA